MGSIGWPELVIILIVVLVLFGGTRLAGLGKASGKAIREFKEETRDLRKDDPAKAETPQIPAQPQQPSFNPQPQAAEPQEQNQQPPAPQQ